MLSLARAWSSFADPITPMRAEKKDVANSPSSIIIPEMLTYNITNQSK
jgi:hypothetical protein